MQIKIIKVGELRTNCYIVFDEKTNEAIVIDPGADIENILNELKGLKPEQIVLTHGHYDHVTDAFLLKDKVDAQVLIHKDDEAMMQISTQKKADILLNDGDKVFLGGLAFLIISTPGHSRGSICLYSKEENVLFSGDTLFAGDYGRVDLPQSSPGAMIASLKKLLSLPLETKVFPGHGRTTTIRDEQNLIK
ncbi:MAG: metallo-beta-lactamase [Candidatus Saganbacteria bacterium]|uniref:Metallo-beta-lactamase n=1 Tax=Candidatus Saganbacteria bacterium TaxID=2575572 RepID=A0A833NY73_UNCSA|nr:MAG: metallo-beta-lactamase [Candidatus Saganbacteria bacterium]